MENNRKYFKALFIPVYIFLVYIVIGTFVQDFSKIDITGFGRTFLHIVVIIFGILCIGCFIYAKLVSKEGVNYQINKIISAILLIFAITCMGLGIYLRFSEEKFTKENFADSKVNLNNVTDIKNYLKTYIEEPAKKQTSQDDRIEVIKNEIDKMPNTFLRYIIVFTTGGSLHIGRGLNFSRANYYITYTVIFFSSLYLAFFFWKNSKMK